MKKRLRIILYLLASLFVLGCAIIFIPNLIVKNSVKDNIISLEEVKKLEDIDCAVILGAGVRNNEPSPMLRDRLLTGISLYDEALVPKLIMSGDHGSTEYDEVNIMKSYAIDKGVKSNDIFMDHAGFSTYETIYRAKKIFEADSIIIVTQKYRLYRALYIAERLGIRAYGVSADLDVYAGQTVRNLREILARDKDFFKCITKPNPTYLGDTIPVSGDGNATND